mgnify:CR=1 FL=1
MFESAEKMLDQAELPEKGIEIEKRVFDEENDLPFADNSLDLVVSSLKLETNYSIIHFVTHLLMQFILAFIG